MSLAPFFSGFGRKLCASSSGGVAPAPQKIFLSDAINDTLIPALLKGGFKEAKTLHAKQAFSVQLAQCTDESAFCTGTDFCKISDANSVIGLVIKGTPRDIESYFVVQTNIRHDRKFGIMSTVAKSLSLTDFVRQIGDQDISRFFETLPQRSAPSMPAFHPHKLAVGQS